MTEKTLEKYKLIIDEWFVNGFNGTKAHQKLYPESKDTSSASNFDKILRITEIQDYVSDKKEEAKAILRTSHEALLDELERWAYSDITETLLLSPDQLKDLPPEIRRLITKFESNTKTYLTDSGTVDETTVKLWFVSKEKAMEMIHKHVGFYERDNSQKQSDISIPIIEWVKE